MASSLRRALYTAVQDGDASAVRVLLDATPSLAQAALDDNDMTALHWLCFQPLLTAAHVEIVRLLLAHGADPHLRLSEGSTPLHFAAQQGHLDVIRLLAKHGADWWTQRVDCLTPVHEAVTFGRVDVLAFFDAMDPEADWDAAMPGTNQLSLLYWAVCCEQPAIIEFLLNRRRPVDVNRTWSRQMTALGRAVQMLDPVLVDILLAHGADVNVSAASVIPPLLCAVRAGDAVIAERLLRAGADPEPHRASKSSPLCVAARRGDVAMIRLLVKYGADVNKCDGLGDLPLHEGVRKKQCSVVKFLINSAGVDVNMPRWDGLSAVQLAIWSGETAMASILSKYAALRPVL
ncbi:hypothetical protein Poli38472_009494 [Pythium oligandrum]|uniref:Ankyrin repeat protein n=1 Tax=Pythium oligandrum TaxID=41045 RepID=A0A8K1CEK8_PYTOL|nr:hypothetical protein Poli38472_009494 [Pythium oligandrum]|eukprot:TMW62001.1 hypothetical protein Poli38472_009494 [Pythium oligandrum]